MSRDEDYFAYLKQRSAIGALYRKLWLYPRISERLSGVTLDVGCGLGDMLAYRPNTVGVDVNAQTVQFCIDRGLQARKMDYDVLPFPSGVFDSVLLDNVLEHIHNPVPILLEAKRVLRTEGQLVVGVPGERGWHADSDHKVKYDENSLVAVVEASGFKMAELFHTPLGKSDWLSAVLRQYCIYGLFRAGPP